MQLIAYQTRRQREAQSRLAKPGPKMSTGILTIAGQKMALLNRRSVIRSADELPRSR